MTKDEKSALLAVFKKKIQKCEAAREKAQNAGQEIFYTAKMDAYKEMVTCVESDHHLRVQNFKNRTAWR